jgi:hypothetical protein
MLRAVSSLWRLCKVDMDVFLFGIRMSRCSYQRERRGIIVAPSGVLLFCCKASCNTEAFSLCKLEFYYSFLTSTECIRYALYLLVVGL